MKILFLLIFCIINIVPCLSESKSTMFFINAKENPLLATSKKPALRYGFHRTEDCKSFDKAFLCIQKCIDLNYDVAHADKHCRCTCYTKQERAKYKPASLATKTRWRSGPPKTSIPYWAGGNKENKTREDGSDSSAEGLTGDDTGTEKIEGGATGATDSTNLGGGTGGTEGTGGTGATGADGSAGTGGTDATNAGGSDATAAEGATGGGEATEAPAAEK